ncbi:MAG: hypothetical protein CM15mP120_10490 [Pseudomonadota bacterium]|nr:MAG: hypothetical protein CM15mP120_10490 [Pseudomonadota bacterium]
MPEFAGPCQWPHIVATVFAECFQYRPRSKTNRSLGGVCAGQAAMSASGDFGTTGARMCFFNGLPWGGGRAALEQH